MSPRCSCLSLKPGHDTKSCSSPLVLPNLGRRQPGRVTLHVVREAVSTSARQEHISLGKTVPRVLTIRFPSLALQNRPTAQ